jgi:chromosome segregation ATPase
MGRQSPAVRHRARVIALVLALLATSATVWGVWSRTRSDQHRIDTELAAVRKQLDARDKELRTAGVARDDARASLTVAQQQLARSRSAASLAHTQLVARNHELSRKRSVLTSTITDLQHRFVQLANLNTCLAGAAKALNQAAVSDTNGMAATLQSVETQCGAARATP